MIIKSCDNIELYAMTIKNKKISFNFIDIFTVVYCGFCLLELTANSYKYICLGLLLLWWILAFLSDEYAAIKTLTNKIIQVLFVYVIVFFFYIAFTRDIISGLKDALTLIINESPFFIYVYYKNRRNQFYSSKLLVWSGLGVILLLCINIARLLAIDPNAARIMAAYHNIYEGLIFGGGYQLAYSLTLLIPFLIFSLKTYRHKFIVFLLILIFIYTLIKCSYTIALLLSLLELFLLIYWCGAKRQISISLCGLLILFILCFLLRDTIAYIMSECIAPIFSGSFIEHRIRQVGELLQGVADEHNGAVVRFNLYRASMLTFLQSPLIGISYLTKFNTILEANYMGLHSTILDGLARMGCLFFLYLIYFGRSIAYLKRKTENNCTVIVGVILFLIRLINTGNGFGLSYIALFCVPMLLERSVQRNKIF